MKTYAHLRLISNLKYQNSDIARERAQGHPLQNLPLDPSGWAEKDGLMHRIR